MMKPIFKPFPIFAAVDDDEAKRRRVMTAIDIGGGQETDVLRVTRELFAMDKETRRWFAECLLTPPKVLWDWPD